MNTERNHYDEMFEDLRYLLEWLGIAMFCVAVVQTIEAVTSMTDGHWVSGSIHAFAAIVFYVAWFRTESRASSYRIALRWWAAQRAREDRAVTYISVEAKEPLDAGQVRALYDSVRKATRRGRGRQA